MTANFKTGTFLEGQEYNSWHREEDRLPIERIVVGDNVTKAMKKANMYDIKVVKANATIAVPMPDGSIVHIPSGKPQLAMTGVPWETDGIQLLNRPVDWVGIVQNSDYAEILNPLTEKYQMIGVMHVGTKGETIVIQMEMPDFYVKDHPDERTRCMFTVAENRLTGEKFYGDTFVRVVCENTYMMATGDKDGFKALPNTDKAKELLQFRTSVEELLIRKREQEHKALNDMFTTPVSKTKVSEVANAMFPMPKRPAFLNLVDMANDAQYNVEADEYASTKERKDKQRYDAAMNRQEEYVKDFFARVDQFNDEHSYAANTQYAVLQGMTSYWNHTETMSRTPQDQKTYNLYFGKGQKAIQRGRKVLLATD